MTDAPNPDQPGWLAGQRVLVIGAGGRLGRRISQRLITGGAMVTGVVHRSRPLPGLPAVFAHNAVDPGAMAPLLTQTDWVICAAPAEIAAALAPHLPQGVKLLAVGSLRRLLVDDAGGIAARAAEAAVTAAGGVILHPAQLWGDGDDSIAQMLRRCRSWPTWLPMPVPGGDRFAQPLHSDDAAQCFLAAMARWPLPVAALDLAGPRPLRRWRLVQMCQRSLGRWLPPLPVPTGPVLWAMRRWPRLPWPATAAEVSRLGADQVADIKPMVQILGVTPRAFDPEQVRQLVDAPAPR
ncbi:MAG: hypothetical protein SF002_04665 [Alphaproteobacteria bacterium]|nr:hypothetical protein [Alphaproteobacteria bacterium]